MAAYSVLIVEDHPELGRMLGAGLKSLGQEFEIVNVPSGEEALLVANSQPMDLLLADYLLPGINGLELIAKLKARQPAIKSILITGSTSEKVRSIVANAGADAFFYKPVAFTDLLDAVRKSLTLGESAEKTEPSPEPAADEEEVDSEEDESEETISDHLSHLRQRLQAQSVLLVDDRGQSLIQAGDLPDGLDEGVLMPTLMTALSAGGKVSHLLGKKIPENLLSFAGKNFDVYLTPVGLDYAVIIIAAYAGSPEERSAAIPVILQEVQGLPALLERMGIPMEDDAGAVSSAEPEPEVEVEGSAEEIDALFEEVGQIALSSDEVDAFWDISEQGMDTGSLSADDLSYDQAQKLGFTPGDTPADE